MSFITISFLSTQLVKFFIIMYYEVRHSSKIGGWRLKKGKATSEHLHLCYGSKMAIRTIHKYLFKHLRFFKGILDFRCLKKQERKQGDKTFRIWHLETQVHTSCLRAVVRSENPGVPVAIRRA